MRAYIKAFDRFWVVLFYRVKIGNSFTLQHGQLVVPKIFAKESVFPQGYVFVSFFLLLVFLSLSKSSLCCHVGLFLSTPFYCTGLCVCASTMQKLLMQL